MKVKDFLWRASLALKTGWSREIIQAITTKEEAEVYRKAGLYEGRVNGHPVLLNPIVDSQLYADNCSSTWYGEDHPSYRGWTNLDLLGEGYPPHDEVGDTFELHHLGQQPNSPLAELTWRQHMGGNNAKTLHRYGNESEIDRPEFNAIRSSYWLNRNRNK